MIIILTTITQKVEDIIYNHTHFMCLGKQRKIFIYFNIYKNIKENSHLPLKLCKEINSLKYCVFLEYARI